MRQFWIEVNELTKQSAVVFKLTYFSLWLLVLSLGGRRSNFEAGMSRSLFLKGTAV